MRTPVKRMRTPANKSRLEIINSISKALRATPAIRLYYVCLLKAGKAEAIIPIQRAQHMQPLSSDSSSSDWRLLPLSRELSQLSLEWDRIEFYRLSSLGETSDSSQEVPSLKQLRGESEALSDEEESADEYGDQNYEKRQTLSCDEYKQLLEPLLTKKEERKVNVTRQLANRNMILLAVPLLAFSIPGIALMADAIAVSASLAQSNLLGLSVGSGILLAVALVCLVLLVKNGVKLCRKNKMLNGIDVTVKERLSSWFDKVKDVVSAPRSHGYSLVPTDPSS